MASIAAPVSHFPLGPQSITEQQRQNTTKYNNKNQSIQQASNRAIKQISKNQQSCVEDITNRE
jgi:hypothetical protein